MQSGFAPPLVTASEPEQWPPRQACDGRSWGPSGLLAAIYGEMKFLRQADGTSLECFAQSMGGPFRKHKLKLSCGIVEGDRQKNMTLTCRTGRVDRDRAVVQ